MNKERKALQDNLKNPLQPLFEDESGTLRFKANGIVEYLVRTGKANLNEIACMDFTEEDRQQFSQLHGYSLGGFSDLSSTTDEVYYAAVKMHENPELSSLQARYDVLEEQLRNLKDALKGPIAELYGIHPEDLSREGY